MEQAGNKMASKGCNVREMGQHGADNNACPYTR
jgi:hypothetical protein